MARYGQFLTGLLTVALVVVAPAKAADIRLATGGTLDIAIATDASGNIGGISGLKVKSSVDSGTGCTAGDLCVGFTNTSNFSFNVDNSGLFAGVIAGSGTAPSDFLSFGSASLTLTIPLGTSTVSVPLTNLKLSFATAGQTFAGSITGPVVVDTWGITGTATLLGAAIPLPLFVLKAVGSSPIASYSAASGNLSLSGNLFSTPDLSALAAGFVNIPTTTALTSSTTGTVTTVSAVPEPSPLLPLLLGGLVFAGVGGAFRFKVGA
jgi:hypothetical protein